MTPEQLQALIDFIRAAAWRAADEQSGQVSPSSDRREEAELRAAFAGDCHPAAHPKRR